MHLHGPPSQKQSVRTRGQVDLPPFDSSAQRLVTTSLRRAFFQGHALRRLAVKSQSHLLEDAVASAIPESQRADALVPDRQAIGMARH